MTEQRLPPTAFVQKLASQNADLNGSIALSELTRLHAAVAGSDGDASVTLHFAIDDQGRRRVSGTVSCDLQVYCQRCLTPMPWVVNSDIDAVLVADDEAAQQVPRQLDLAMTEAGVLDVHEFIEDELLLSLPFTSFHQHDCIAAEVSDKETEQSQTHKPFAGLAKIINSR